MKLTIILHAVKSTRRFASAKTTAATKQLEKYAVYNPVTLSLKDFVEFGNNGDSFKKSFLFLRKELPVRLANIMKEISVLPDQLISMPSVQLVESWYEQSFQDLLQFEKANEKDSAILEDFTDKLIHIRNRHSDVVQTMGHGIMEMKERSPDASIQMFKQTQYFLDRFYLMRISIRMLINQHIIMFDPKQEAGYNRHMGAIDPDCDIIAIAKDAYSNAKFLCEQFYMQCPEIELTVLNPYEKRDDVLITYVPSHLYHMLFELYKNAMRAIVEHHSESIDVPSLKTFICKSQNDVTIKICDQGGGIAKNKIDRLFNYMYTTAPTPPSPDSASTTPLAGYGYGLPLSKLYAKYFQGDLVLSSVDGYGTDAIIYLKTQPRYSNELLPIYNYTSRQHYDDRSNPVNDWSDDSQSGYIHQGFSQPPSRKMSSWSQRRHDSTTSPHPVSPVSS